MEQEGRKEGRGEAQALADAIGQIKIGGGASSEVAVWMTPRVPAPGSLCLLRLGLALAGTSLFYQKSVGATAKKSWSDGCGER